MPWTLWVISSVTLLCSSVAAATWVFMSLIASICPVMVARDSPVRWLACTPVPVAAWPACIELTAFSAPSLRP